MAFSLAATGCASRPAAFATLAEQRPSVLTVVTWNLNAGRGELPRFISDLSTGRLTGAPVAQYVILLQEAVDTGELGIRALATSRGLSAFYVPVRSVSVTTTGNAIVATRELLNARAIDLPRARQPRAAVAATIEVAGERLFLASVHLENRISWLRGGLFAEGARGRQAEALVRSLPSTGAGIVGGDLNTWLGPNEPAWRILNERFEDTPRGEPEPTFRDRLTLDHLFFDLPEHWRATRRVVPERYGSDHHPVVATIDQS